jgi:L-rhamnose isomerase
MEVRVEVFEGISRSTERQAWVEEMKDMPTREVTDGWAKEKTVPIGVPSDEIEVPGWKGS